MVERSVGWLFCQGTSPHGLTGTSTSYFLYLHILKGLKSRKRVLAGKNGWFADGSSKYLSWTDNFREMRCLRMDTHVVCTHIAYSINAKATAGCITAMFCPECVIQTISTVVQGPHPRHLSDGMTPVAARWTFSFPNGDTQVTAPQNQSIDVYSTASTWKEYTYGFVHGHLSKNNILGDVYLRLQKPRGGASVDASTGT